MFGILLGRRCSKIARASEGLERALLSGVRRSGCRDELRVSDYDLVIYLVAHPLLKPTRRGTFLRRQHGRVALPRPQAPDGGGNSAATGALAWGLLGKGVVGRVFPGA